MTEGILNALLQHVQHITCGNNIIDIQYHMHRAGSKLLFSVPQPFQKKHLKKNNVRGWIFLRTSIALLCRSQSPVIFCLSACIETSHAEHCCTHIPRLYPMVIFAFISLIYIITSSRCSVASWRIKVWKTSCPHVAWTQQ